MRDDKPILEFAGVTLADESGYDSGLEDVALILRAGELAVVHASPARRLPLADAAQGLVAAARGAVRFLGRAWPDRSPDEAAADRARIGRTFHDSGWFGNLDVDENITLKARHHSARSRSDIEAEAARLASRFGFDELPRARPAWVEPETLARAQWIRALLGTPVLLLLEFPDRAVDAAHVAMLKEAVRRRVDQGAAALWITADSHAANDGTLKANTVGRIEGTRWSAPRSMQ